MNILVVNWQDWHNPLAGGAEVYLYEIFSRLVERGHKVTLLASRGSQQGRNEHLEGFTIYRVGKRYNFNYHVPCGLRALLRSGGFDIIVDDLNKIPFYSAAITRVPVLPMVMHIFQSTIYREANPLLASYVYLSERLIPFFYPRSDFVAISHSTADELREIGVRGTIHVIECGVPVVPDTRGDGPVGNLVAYVGRVKRYKSIDHFVKAMAFVKKKRDVKILIVGDGDAKEELVSLAAELDVDIEFTGFVSEDKKNSVYRSARVIVQPSVKEGWGLTAIEAQSHGTPVVCADSPGLREVVVDGKTGYLYRYGDVEALAEKVINLLDDERLWYSFSQAAVKWVRTFSWETATDKMEAVLTSVVKRSRQ